jgi:hypothetical protein
MVEIRGDVGFDNTGRQPKQNQTDATDVRLEQPDQDTTTAADYPVVPEPPAEPPARST